MPRLVEFESTEYEFPDDATDDEVFSTLESLSIRNSPEAKAMKAAPKGLPSMPRPQVAGLGPAPQPKPQGKKTLPDLPQPKVPGLNAPAGPGPIEAGYEKDFGPDSLPAKLARPFARTADWMIEGMEYGPGRIESGYKTAASRDPKVTPDQRFQGMADMLGGTLDTARPLLPAMARSLPGALKEAPKLTTAEIALGTAGPPIVKQGMEALGAPEGASNLAAEATGVAPLASLASRTLRKPLTSEPKLGQTEITKPKTQGPQPPIDTGLLPPEAPASSAVASATPDEAIVPELDLFEQIKASGVTSRQGIQRKFKLSNKEAKAYATRLVSESSSVAPPKGAQPKTSPAVTVTEKAKTSKIRPIKEVLSDESGALDVDKFLDLMGEVKNRLTTKDPLDAQIEARKNAGKVATGIHEHYSDYVRETHPLWMAQELIKGEEAKMGIRASIGEGLEKYGVPLEKQPAALIESMSGTQGKIALDLDMAREALMPFRDTIRSAVKDYGIRQRHVERGGYKMTDDDGNVIPYKLPGGESLADNAAAMAAYEAKMGPEGMKEVEGGLQNFRLIYKYLLEKSLNGDLITKDFKEGAEQYNQMYIPAKRLEFILDELQNDRIIPVGQRAHAVGEKEFQHRLKGSDKEIVDPFISLVRDVIRVNRAIESNKARKALAGLADQPGNNGLFLKVGSDGKPLPYVDASGKTVRPGIPMGYEPVSYLEQGVKKQLLVPKDIAAIYSGMDADTANMVTKMMGHFSNALRFGVTANPVFWAGNLARDYWTAVQTVGLDPVTWAQGLVASTFRDIPNGKVADLLNKFDMGPKLYKQYLASGGSHSGMNEMSSLPMMADNLLDTPAMRIAKTVWNPRGKSLTGKVPGVGLLEYAGTTAELGPRLAVVRKRLKQGDDLFAAGWASRNATINFAVGGKALKSFYQIVPFLKGRTGASRTGLESLGKQPKLTALRLGTQLGIPSAALYYANVMRYPQVWASIDDDTKRNHAMLIYGDKQDAKGRYTEIISAPLDGIPAAFYGALIGAFEIVRGADPMGWGRNAVQLFSDSMPVGFTRKGELSANEFLSAVMPSLFSTAYTAGSGKDLYTGRDLERQPNVRRDAAPEDRYNLEAKKPLVAAAQGLSKIGIHVSPHVLENMPKTTFGHTGRAITEAMPTVGGDGKSGLQRTWDAIKLQPFTKPIPSKPTLDLEVETKVQTRGSRFQDYSREIERISKVAKSGGEYQDLTQVAIQDFVKKYPDRNPNLVAKEFLASQKRFMIAKQKNFSAQERSIYSAPAEVRAELIRDAFAQMKPASRASVWADWKRKGIISSSVSREYRLLMEQDRRKAAAPVQ